MRTKLLACVFLYGLLIFGPSLNGVANTSPKDWPQFRYDAGRSAASPLALPEKLQLQWMRELPSPRPAFPNEIRLRFDASYEPVAWGKTLFVPSMVADCVTAYFTDSGKERWTFFADGPIRFAPLAWSGRVYFVSDDGHLYCVSADRGELLWKFRGLPDDRQDRLLLGDGRLISLRPARGGPVLRDGVIYFGAGIWLGDGTYVHALDARTGKQIWSNTDSSLLARVNHDHNVEGYGGVSPQGYLTLLDQKLIVACGNQLPAFLDAKTGALEPYTMGWGGHGQPKGSWLAAGAGKYLFHSGDLFDVSRHVWSLLLPGQYRMVLPDPTRQSKKGVFHEPIISPDTLYLTEPNRGLVAYDLANPHIVRGTDRLGRSIEKSVRFSKRWTIPSKLNFHIKAGPRIYVGGPGIIQALDVSSPGKPSVSWQSRIQGTPSRMLAADNKLFVVTREGRIYAFGGQASKALVYQKPKPGPIPNRDQWTAQAERLLQKTGAREGYALMPGLGSGRLAEELIRQSQLKVIGIDPDAERVKRLRERFHQAGLYGARISLRVGDPFDFSFPPYLADLIVSEDFNRIDRDVVERLVRSLRPYGGTAVFPASKLDAENLLKRELKGIEARQVGELIRLRRPGALPGSADWSHTGANAGNAGASQDTFVKPPLGILWFDGSMRWFRWGAFTGVRVAGGRVYVLRSNLTAVDAFTGRRLWQAKLPNQGWKPAPEFVALEDAIYIPFGKFCVALDPATGKRRNDIVIPAAVSQSTSNSQGWSQVRVQGDHFVGAVGRELVCLDRRTGTLRWRHRCQHDHLSIALGADRVFCAELRKIDRRKAPEDYGEPRTSAFDLQTGEILWQIPQATELRYSATHDLLVTPGGILRPEDGSLERRSPFRIIGKREAHEKYVSVGLTEFSIAGDTIIETSQQTLNAYDLATGERLIGDLKWHRRGCTFLRASPRFATTRFQGNAAYIDLRTQRITELWNIRSGCNNNLFPANGILNVPNVTGGCTCNYLPVSMAFAPLSVLEPTANPPR